MCVGLFVLMLASFCQAGNFCWPLDTRFKIRDYQTTFTTGVFWGSHVHRPVITMRCEKVST